MSLVIDILSWVLLVVGGAGRHHCWASDFNKDGQMFECSC